MIKCTLQPQPKARKPANPDFSIFDCQHSRQYSWCRICAALSSRGAHLKTARFQEA
jgi:hypothetical protein